jgi:hypothetical protein
MHHRDLERESQRAVNPGREAPFDPHPDASSGLHVPWLGARLGFYFATGPARARGLRSPIAR